MTYIITVHGCDNSFHVDYDHEYNSINEVVIKYYEDVPGVAIDTSALFVADTNNNNGLVNVKLIPLSEYLLVECAKIHAREE
jgi:hypothetical protein